MPEPLSPQKRASGILSAYNSPCSYRTATVQLGARTPLGFDELNDLGSKCSQIRMDIVPITLDLMRAIEDEKTRPKPPADRTERLRTLVEALANWWRSVTGKSLAPYVYAKRLGDRRAFVVGRRGPFIELAQALFSSIDEFKDSEVISAVTNVHESELAKAKQQLAN